MREKIIKNLRESCPWQDSLLWFDSIESTNTHARELARQGAAHGTVLIADHQTGGRGRLGRSFHSPAGSGVYMSVILRPNCNPQEIMHLTCAAAVAMCDAVETAAGFRPGIKWTNDLVYGTKKLGGILTELGLKNDGTVDYAIIGIGINCCHTPEDFPEDIRPIAASLSMVTEKLTDRCRLAAALMEILWDMDQHLLSGQEAMLGAIIGVHVAGCSGIVFVELFLGHAHIGIAFRNGRCGRSNRRVGRFRRLCVRRCGGFRCRQGRCRIYRRFVLYRLRTAAEQCRQDQQ